MFLINSCLGLFTATYLRRLPFSRSYGVILPSSLTRVLPFVFEFSSRLPVSVCGTGTFSLFSNFSRQCRFKDFSTNFDPHQTNPLHRTYFTIRQDPFLRRAFPSARFLYLPVSLLHLGDYRWYRNFNLLSIIYVFRPRLRSRLTLGGRTFPRKPQTLDGVVSRHSLATYAGILSSVSSTAAFATASANTHCSSTNAITCIPMLRCQVLAPLIFGAPSLDQ